MFRKPDLLEYIDPKFTRRQLRFLRWKLLWLLIFLIVLIAGIAALIIKN